MASIQEALNRMIGTVSGGVAVASTAISHRMEKVKKAQERQAQAEYDSAERLKSKASSQQNIVSGLAERFDLLSAKEKRQVLDVAHKLKKRGEGGNV